MVVGMTEEQELEDGSRACCKGGQMNDNGQRFLLPIFIIIMMAYWLQCNSGHGQKPVKQ